MAKKASVKKKVKPSMKVNVEVTLGLSKNFKDPKLTKKAFADLIETLDYQIKNILCCKSADIFVCVSDYHPEYIKTCEVMGSIKAKLVK